MAVVYILNTFKLDIDRYLDKCNDQIRIKKINQTKDIIKKKEHLGAYLLLKDYLETICFMEGINPIIEYSDSGKPYFKDLNKKLSISHSNGIVAVIVSNDDIGIDIEKIDESRLKLAKNVFTEEEMNIYNTLSQKDKISYFFEVWTSKEAQVKKDGIGLNIHPKTIDITTDVATKRIKIGKEEYMIAVTLNDSFKVIERFVYNFNESEN